MTYKQWKVSFERTTATGAVEYRQAEIVEEPDLFNDRKYTLRKRSGFRGQKPVFVQNKPYPSWDEAYKAALQYTKGDMK